MFGSIGMPELIIIFVIASDHFRAPETAGTGPIARQEAWPNSSSASNELKSTLEEEIRLEEQRTSLEETKAKARRGGSRSGDDRDCSAAVERAGPGANGRPQRVSAHLSWPWCPSQAPSRGPMRVLYDDEDDDP